MKVIKPQKLGLLTRTFEHDRQPYLVTTVLGFFHFGAPSLFSEIALWKFVAAELGKDAMLDFGMPKDTAELLITGSAFAPGGVERPAVHVRARMAGIDKTLYAIGDRHWRGSAPSAPKPFVEMPITWNNAFGGAGYARNPVGKGLPPPDDPGALYQLPNIEDPRQLITSPRDRPEPAGFGAFDMMLPQRQVHMGTYDSAWLAEGYPGLAHDMSLAAFNTAPPDQRLTAYFAADEPFALENLHPDKSLIEGRLPGVIARCFINQKTATGEMFREIPLRLETIHLFPKAERGVVVFRGLAAVDDEDGDDVLHLVVAGERTGAARSAEHYQAVLRRRLERRAGSFTSFRDDDLFPAEGPEDAAPDDAAEDRALLATESLAAKNLRRRAEIEREKVRVQLREQGLDPDRHLPPMPKEPPQPSEGDLDTTVEGLLTFSKQQHVEAEALRKDAEDRARQQCAEHGLDFDKLLEEQRRAGGGPPKFSAEEQLQSLRDAAQLARNAGVDLPHVEEQLADPSLEAKLVAVERRLREAYVALAHLFPEAQPMAEETSRALRREIEAEHRAGRSLAGRDLTGADLAGISLPGADLRGAMLEGAALAGADLHGADATGAVLARADLTGADLTGALLRGANLGAAKLRGAKAGGADLTGAVLVEADLTAADLRGAHLDRTDLSEAKLVGADLTGAVAPGLSLSRVDLANVKLAGADLGKSTFSHVDVSGVDFGEATLTSAVFLSTKGEGAVFRGAKLANLRVVSECSFAGADFAGADLTGAHLRGANLAGADFTEARLADADLSVCDLRRAVFYLAHAPDARFVKADLTGADMTSANLMNALLQRATVHGVSFEGANLFRADLFRIRVDGATRMTDAELGQVRFIEARRADEQG